MGLRTIRTGIGTYLDKGGQWAFGTFGEEVEVHKDDLERFDRLNPEEPEPEEKPDETPDEMEAKLSQADVDAAVKAATDAKDAEIDALRKEKDAEITELRKQLDAPKPASAARTAAK